MDVSCQTISARRVILGVVSVDAVYGDVGSAVPDFDLTNPMSALLRKPSVFTSSRALVLVTTVPDCALVWPISALFTNPSPLVSPNNTPNVADTVPWLA